jgi:nucleoside-diphosphate-sugar epimerase
VAHGRFWTAPENAAWLEASTALAARFAEAGGRRLIGIGTCAEYAEGAAAAGGDGTPWPETRLIAPATPYGQAKAALAARLAALAERRPGRLSAAWARLFHLFGPGEHPDRLVPSVARALLAGREADCASGRPVRDFAGTPFVGRAVAALAASGVEGPVNIASGRATTIRALVETLGRLTGRPGLLRFGRLPDRPGEAPYVVADTGRLTEAVGFREPPELEHDLRAILAGIAAAELTPAGA